MFGHVITLNFEQNGDTYNTHLGGLVSIILKLFLTFYVVTCVFRMVFYERDETITNIGSQDLLETGVVNYEQLGITMLHVLRKQGGESLLTIKDLNKYFTVKFVLHEIDWTKPVDDGRYKDTEFETKPCDLEDYPYLPGNDE